MRRPQPHPHHAMSDQRSTLRTIRQIHESMIALGSAPRACESAPVQDWLDAELALLDRLRVILAGATHLDGYALLPRERLEAAKDLIDSAIGAKSMALDLLQESGAATAFSSPTKQLG